MREETKSLIDDCVNYVVINPVINSSYEEWYGSSDKMDIDNVADNIYKELLIQAEETYGYSKAVRFDGKKAIMERIKTRLVELMKEEGLDKYL